MFNGLAEELSNEYNNSLFFSNENSLLLTRLKWASSRELQYFL